MTEVTATLTENRADGMQKWERTELPKQDCARYIWMRSQVRVVGTVAMLVFNKGTGGAVGGHWAGWQVKA